MINIPFILNQEYPGQVWIHAGSVDSYAPQIDADGNPLSGLFWGNEDTRQKNISNSISKPSLESLQALWESKYSHSWDVSQVHEQRAAEYPPITDYLDGVVKGDQAQVQAYIDACLVVKAKYPKPSDQ